MPNTRRRRFSVQNEIARRESKSQNGLSTSHSDPDSEIDMVATNIVTRKSPRHKNKFYANDSKSSTLEIVAECESNISLSTAKKRSIMTMDKAVYASSSTLLNSGTATEECNLSSANRLKTVATTIEAQKKSNERQSSRRDKHPRQHRVKVRSPKRRVPIIEQQNKAVDSNKRSAGTTAIDWDIELELLVDSLGIMLMSPLAVLAAWLSGRTLAGLMTQEGHVTPWPLASTFVLACMTLVCYYCWIVSAATRHALGWWIWYRSQYEVRLQIQENED
ncbi:unnamed protein product [Spodoptera exigua]|nr:unnamed protein product [Spodoptera exigua]